MGEWRSNFDDFCKVCNKVTSHESASYDDETSITCLEHDEIEESQYNARQRIQELHSINVYEEIQSLLHENHTENNCQCNDHTSTETMRSQGAGDIEVCLKCFGAKGCVY